MEIITEKFIYQTTKEKKKLGLFSHYINHVNNLGVPGKLIQNL